VGARPLTLEVYLDSSSVEVFADGGRVALTDLILPAEPDGIEVYSVGGPVTLARLDVAAVPRVRP
jgi:sucrose-6-phosphate hydrolase SacC (GH32 family)